MSSLNLLEYDERKSLGTGLFFVTQYKTGPREYMEIMPNGKIERTWSTQMSMIGGYWKWWFYHNEPYRGDGQVESVPPSYWPTGETWESEPVPYSVLAHKDLLLHYRVAGVIPDLPTVLPRALKLCWLSFKRSLRAKRRLISTIKLARREKVNTVCASIKHPDGREGLRVSRVEKDASRSA